MIKRLLCLSLFFAAFFAKNALAYYDPHTGRWLSRDPIDDLGRQALEFAISPEQTDQPKTEEIAAPYVFVGNHPISSVDAFGLKEWSFTVVTEIEQPHGLLVPKSAVGVKTTQSFKVDDQTGEILNYYEFTAATFELVPALSSFSHDASLDKQSCPLLHVSMSGSAKNLANPFLGSIQYSYTFLINTSTGETLLTGDHRGFPSYTVRTDKGSDYFHETNVSQLYSWTPEIHVHKDFK